MVNIKNRAEKRTKQQIHREMVVRVSAQGACVHGGEANVLNDARPSRSILGEREVNTGETNLYTAFRADKESASFSRINTGGNNWVKGQVFSLGETTEKKKANSSLIRP